jgi:hypothetical protein
MEAIDCISTPANGSVIKKKVIVLIRCITDAIAIALDVGTHSPEA